MTSASQRRSMRTFFANCRSGGILGRSRGRAQLGLLAGLADFDVVVWLLFDGLLIFVAGVIVAEAAAMRVASPVAAEVRVFLFVCHAG